MILLIGYGNTLRCDDGVGVIAAEQVAAVVHVDLLTVHQLTPELVEPISQAALVIFIDAQAGGNPGTISRQTVTVVPTQHAFTHLVTPSGLLAQSQRLYGRQPQGVLYTVDGATFAYGETLSQQVQSVLPHLVREVARTITTWRETNDDC